MESKGTQNASTNGSSDMAKSMTHVFAFLFAMVMNQFSCPDAKYRTLGHFIITVLGKMVAAPMVFIMAMFAMVALMIISLTVRVGASLDRSYVLIVAEPIVSFTGRVSRFIAVQWRIINIAGRTVTVVFL